MFEDGGIPIQISKQVAERWHIFALLIRTSLAILFKHILQQRADKRPLLLFVIDNTDKPTKPLRYLAQICA